MKVSLFEQVPYRHLPPDFEERHSSVVTTPYHEIVDPELMTESLRAGYTELLHAARSGFDGICVTEHSQSTYDISPNPNLMAAAVAQAAAAEGLDTAITVLGRSLGKSREPLKVAEEYALLDCISGGRLIAGFPVGLSYDANQNGGIPPIDTRERYREHRELILKAWTARAPFAWNGRFEKYGQVNLWPRPREIVDSQLAIVGSPATVADQIEAFVRAFRIGNLLVMLQNGSMPRDLTEKNISLFADEVLPRLRPIWDDEGWEHRWWPHAANRTATVDAHGTAGATAGARKDI